MFDLMVLSEPHASAQLCGECRAQLATTHIVIARVERGGCLVTDRVRETCGTCSTRVADTLRVACQYRLYQGRKV